MVLQKAVTVMLHLATLANGARVLLCAEVRLVLEHNEQKPSNYL